MRRYTADSGQEMASVKVQASKSGKMAVSTKDTGKTTKLTGMADLYILTVIATAESG